MARAGPSSSIAELRRVLERAETPAGAREALPFGVAAIDGYLPGGGLAQGALHEVIDGGSAETCAAVATLFIGGILARLAGPVLWCCRSRDLFAPALARIGLHPDRVIFCETGKDRDVHPSMEEGLRCAGLAGVVGEVTKLSLTASRRLQLAAGHSGVMALVLRRWWTAEQYALAGEPNAAVTWWRLSQHPSLPGPFEGMPRALWHAELLRVRGGEAHSWIVEACDAQGGLALPAALAVRPAAAKAWQRAAAG
jgi:protein ImuA